MTARALIERGGAFAGLILVAVIFGALVGPQFFSAGNLELMARQTAIVSIAAVGMTVVIVAGGIDLSVGSVIALSTVVIALLLREGASPAVAALGAITAAAASTAYPRRRRASTTPQPISTSPLELGGPFKLIAPTTVPVAPSTITRTRHGMCNGFARRC